MILRGVSKSGYHDGSPADLTSTFFLRLKYGIGYLMLEELFSHIIFLGAPLSIV
jgi:hypothetical protein